MDQIGGPSTPPSTSLLHLASDPPSTWSASHLSTLITSLTRHASSREAFQLALTTAPVLLENLIHAVKTPVESDSRYWIELAQLRTPSRDALEGSDSEEGAVRLASSVIDADVEGRLEIAKKAARLLTNGMAGQPEVQRIVFERLQDIRWTLWRLASFHMGQIKELTPLTRILSQCLSNLVTSQPELQQRLFDSLGIVGEGGGEGAEKGSSREAELICRLLASYDAGTRMGAQMMLLNSIAHCESRAMALASSPSGAMLLRTLLEKADELVDGEESEAEREMERLEVDSGIGSLLGERIADGEERGGRDEALGMSPVIMQRLFSLSLFSKAWASLASTRWSQAIEASEDEGKTPRLVSSAQVVLLKFLDADLHGPLPRLGSLASSEDGAAKDLASLVPAFSRLAKGLIDVLRSEVEGSEEEEGSKGGGKIKELAALEEKYKADVVVDAFVALVLVLQCLVWCVVRSEEEDGSKERDSRERGLDHIARAVNLTFRERERGAIEDVVELLRLVSELFPAKSPFGPTVTSTTTATTSSSSVPRDAPRHHVLSSTGSALSDPSPTLQAPTMHVKRSLVQLLAALSFVLPPTSARSLGVEELAERRARVRETQDRVRECKGVTQVLNALQLDERNPYIREHAVLAMRNLLADNAENQAIVASLKAL